MVHGIISLLFTGMKYSDRVKNVTMNLCYEGGGAGFAARPLLEACRAEYACITTCWTLGVMV
jgi:hypothetical protein